MYHIIILHNFLNMLHHSHMPILNALPGSGPDVTTDIQSLTIIFVGDFCFVARFLENFTTISSEINID